MAQFMVMILANEVAEAQLSPSETKVLVEAHAAYEQSLRDTSAYVDGERLRPSIEGKRVRVRDEHARVEAGPFGDVALSGYYVVEADDLDAAVALATKCPISEGTALDVRPLMKGRIRREKASQPGRVFAFAVLGNAPSEKAWVDVMDRMDGGPREDFPADRFLGGVRLLAPTQGRRVSQASQRRVVFDGPFLESKEVIGGLFFMRMASMEEAVIWSRETDHVRHGGVEIRELWRS